MAKYNLWIRNVTAYTYGSQSQIKSSSVANSGEGNHTPDHGLAIMETESAHCPINNLPGFFPKKENIYEKKETNAPRVDENVKELQ